MDLEDLAIFITVAQESSFSGAARKLGLTKAAVSRSVASLEQAVGTRLIHRTTRSVALSSAGKLFFDRITGPLAAINRAINATPDPDALPSGTLRISAAVDCGAMLLSSLVARFVERFPAVRVDVRLSNSQRDLRAESADVAFRFSSGDERVVQESFESQYMTPVTAQLFAAPSYLARRGTPNSPEELNLHEVISLRGASVLSFKAHRELADCGLKCKIECDDLFFVREALRAGTGLGLLPSYLADADVESGALVPVLSSFSKRLIHLWMLHPEGGQMPSQVEAFCKFALDQLRPSAPVIEGAAE